jgi:IS5 family transposase
LKLGFALDFFALQFASNVPRVTESLQKMKPQRTDSQRSLFSFPLEKILDPDHPLVILSSKIDWSQFDDLAAECYSDEGRPGCTTRLMIGLLYLKHAFNESDESVVERWVENPYWQFFCGFAEMQHECPINPSSLSRWRKRVGADRLEKMLEITIQVAMTGKLLKPAQITRVNVDTTVQEKAIAFPTDARLYQKMRVTLVRQAQRMGIPLRQSYRFVGKRALFKQARYAHARQMKRAARMTRKLKTYLGRVVRDIERKAGRYGDPLSQQLLHQQLQLAYRLLAQTRTSKNKLYSIHAPEVECIAKGKAHKRYEFGCKASFVTTSKNNWIVGAQALHGNPYDGHTLAGAVSQAERLTGVKFQDVMCDQGYRGHDYTGTANVHVVRYIPRKAKRAMQRLLRRRSAIEPSIGHMKSDNRLQRNQLTGKEGDRINAVLAAAGYNFRKLLRALFCALFQWLVRRAQPTPVAI